MSMGRMSSAAAAPRGDNLPRATVPLRIVADSEPDRPTDISPTERPLRLFVPGTSATDAIPLADTRSVQWDSIAEPVRSLFFANGDTATGLPLTQWVAEERLAVVKHGPHRTVYRLTTEGPDLAPSLWYIKRFRGGGWTGRLRDRLFGTRAEREYRAARAISELGIPTIEPVLLGHVPHTATHDPATSGDTWLATRGIDGSQPLDEFVTEHVLQFSNADQHAFRTWLAMTLGRIAARLHRAGIRHPDLHAGNLLVTEADAGWTLWLIDLHAVRLNTRLSAGARRDNVAELHRFFAPWSTQSDRARFRGAYLAELGSSRTSLVAELATRADWERALRSAVETGHDRADRAWRRGNRHVRRTSSAAGEFRAVAPLSSDLWSEWIADPDAFLTRRAIQWCKQGKTRRVAEVSLAPADGTAFLKRIERHGWARRLSDAVQLPVARRAWEIGHQLLRRGIDTPRPLACAVLRDDHGPTGAQYLLTEAIPASTTLLDWCAELRANTPCSRVRREGVQPLVLALARILSRLHAAGFDHRDLKFQNLLVGREGAENRIWLLDLDGVRDSRTWRQLPFGQTWFNTRRVQNLARVLASARAHGVLTATDSLRFLRTYLTTTEQRDWKWWWRSIANRADSKQRRNTRRGRSLA
jgi:tRNA A-37 threonylcarbamoyl transferase component Bud32